MQLIGMLDSPYVRRVAVSLQLLGLPFVHRPVSVLRTYAAFAAINPVVKAPTLICDDATVLMDSTLILDYAQSLAGGKRSLLPSALAARQRDLRLMGLALAACEKSVQILYERKLRPAEKQYAPWLERITQQMGAAYAELDMAWTALGVRAPLESRSIDLAAVTTAVAWHFTQRLMPEMVDPGAHPAIQRLSLEAEALPEFIAAPHGEGTMGTSGALA